MLVSVIVSFIVSLYNPGCLKKIVAGYYRVVDTVFKGIKRKVRGVRDVYAVNIPRLFLY